MQRWGKKPFSAVPPVIRLRTRKRQGLGSVALLGVPLALEGVRYSAAMKASGLVWDEATLERFLAAPRDVVPKTTMTVSVPKREDRHNIIAYLKSLSQ